MMLAFAVFFTAVLLRLFHFSAAVDSSYLSSLMVDSWHYHVWAASMASEKSDSAAAASSHVAVNTGFHEMYESGESFRGTPFSKGPLYPAILSLWYRFSEWMTGIPPDETTHKSFLVMQALLGALNCFLIFWLARLYTNRLFSFITGMWAAFYPVFILYDTLLMRESLALFFLILWSLAITMGYRNRRFAAIFFAGLMAGLAAITRESLILLVPFGAIWMMTVEWSTHPIRRSNFRILMVLAFLAGSMISILPVTFINILNSGEAVLISTNGGINFYAGNNIDADGTAAILPGIRWERLRRLEAMETRGSDTISSVQGGTYSFRRGGWWLRGVDFIFERPVQAMKLFLRKILYFAGSRELPNTIDFQRAREDSRILRLPVPGYSFVMAFSLLSCLLCFNGKAHHFMPLLLIPAVVFLTNVLFFTSSRQRLPAVPFMMILASIGFGLLLETWCSDFGMDNIQRDNDRGNGSSGNYFKDNRLRRVSYGILTVLIICFIVSSQRIWPHESSMSNRHIFDLATVMLRNGRLNAAERLFRKSCEAMPEDPDSRFGLAVTLHFSRRISEALEEYRRALKLAPDHTSALNNSGNILLASGETSIAANLFRKAIAYSPWDGNILFNLAVCHERMGDLASASRIYGKALNSGADRAAILNNMAGMNLAIARRSGKKTLIGEALEMARSALVLRPDEPGIHHTLGKILMYQGQFDESGVWLTRAYAELPNNPEICLDMSRWLVRTGRLARALPILEKIVSGWKGSIEARQAEQLIARLSGEKR
ncbi:MAG: hypothetical protein CVV64_14515 [Candidatus Wallbacteria bacterium HGW-Wallbacteria-1]|jgi:Flp pilus assembly protein TadD|uniref:Glycosyltransferase RgtA/B/C/D-like domain-containing protein n=1 Tax=Candidatus Wallbacteria bacterium HGW-Wallbacteria-1 TaxID=2013854 RepID=A0A2N1PM60_9BACT|nr:MAG: hypothetical protein CVV64_14515 [Candidatus Wallbacteria bacterium HGW-Wallbacteria-1]